MKRFISFCLLILITQSCNDKSIYGIWEVSSVSMGDQSMTPIAKWFNIKADGSSTSGNGWLQNSKGTYRYDESSMTYLPINEFGVKDSYGAFTIKELTEDLMVWTHEEDGALITVQLKKVIEIPKGPADKLVGLWKPENNEQNTLRIRWDRIYVEMKNEKRSTGYWHIHGHKPEVTFLPHSKDSEPETWKIEVVASKLIMSGLSDSNRDEVQNFIRLE